MKAILICPDRRPAVALLAESCPLAVAPLMGKCLVEYWIEYLVTLGIREIRIVASDRPAEVAAAVGNGARWGVALTVTRETQELSTEQASEKYGTPNEDSLAIVVPMHHLPGTPGFPLLSSYATWFAGLQTWMPRAQALERIGQYEVRPGVWIGLRTRIAPSTRLLAPCWLGDYVSVGADAVIGPGVILDHGVVVAEGACVTQSVIGPATYVGARTRVANAIAHGNILIDWATNSCLRVPDAFWLSSLRQPLPAPRATVRPGPPMKIEILGPILSVSELDELSAANAGPFEAEIHAALSSALSDIEVDLSRTRLVDSSGLAALYGVYRTASSLGINLRLLHPKPEVLQLFELTQMHHFFCIDQTEPARTNPPKPAPARHAPAPAMIPVH